MAKSQKNQFCKKSDLTNEASVEQFFVNRLLPALGFNDSQIKTKQSLDKLTFGRGRKKSAHKPDYGIVLERKTRLIIDAKATGEKLENHLDQCAGYCHAINREQKENPCQHFVLTNGITTEVYAWDRQDTPLLSLTFDDFAKGADGIDRLTAIVGKDALLLKEEDDGEYLVLRQPSVSEINALFGWCHNTAHKKDNLSYSAAFMAFVKLVFLKLLSDREIRKVGERMADGSFRAKMEDIMFSVRWIESRAKDTANPMAVVQFGEFVKTFEKEIAKRKKKRIFKKGETLDLSAETILAIVEKLESVDLFGIDEDLNGRLFETFLNATLRGKALGQYFTPRSVVKLALAICPPKVTNDHIDIIIDACCGSGGFLIEALAEMWKTVDANPSWTDKEKEDLKQRIAGNNLYGIDVAPDPNLARIARINMYLHGDGGSSIYQIDALDKKVEKSKEDSPEIESEKDEFREKCERGGFIDIAFTNPPFAKKYERSKDSKNKGKEDRILDGYELATYSSDGNAKPRISLPSGIMFIERYLDLLSDGGRIVTVIDDSVLGSAKHQEDRCWIREKYIVEGVVSLPGDAFQRSEARVKTSILILRKKASPEEEQGNAFMYFCKYVGIDDPKRKRVLPEDEETRRLAREEIAQVGALYADYRDGKKSALPYTIPAREMEDRIDVKACLVKRERRLGDWNKNGLEVKTVEEIAEVVIPNNAEGNLVKTRKNNEELTFIKVRYDGFAEMDKKVFAADVTYSTLTRVSAGEVVVSNINAVHGSVAVVPDELDGSVVSSEYTVLRAKGQNDPRLIRLLLRSPEARAEFIASATGIGRTRVKWDFLKALRLSVPTGNAAEKIVNSFIQAEELEREAAKIRSEVTASTYENFLLTSVEAHDIIKGFKPPQ